MPNVAEEPVEVAVGARVGAVAGLLCWPAAARVLYVLAHGAGAGMRHPFMASIAAALGERDVATLRYQFPYAEAGRRRPDPPGVLHATARAAIATARARAPGLALVAGGKSMGGRMTSQALAARPETDVRGLVFLGFPLHTAGRPDTVRAEHLRAVAVPMLFVQGERDALAEPAHMGPVCAALGERARLHVVPGADHGFAVRRRDGRTAAAVTAEVADVVAAWIAGVGGAP
jgi:hypothetical protein